MLRRARREARRHGHGQSRRQTAVAGMRFCTDSPIQPENPEKRERRRTMLPRKKRSPGQDVGEQNNRVKSDNRRHAPAGGRDSTLAAPPMLLRSRTAMNRPIPQTASLKIAIQSLRELGEFGAEIAGDVAIGSVMRLKSASCQPATICRRASVWRAIRSRRQNRHDDRRPEIGHWPLFWSMIEQRISQIVPNTIAASTSLR